MENSNIKENKNKSYYTIYNGTMYIYVKYSVTKGFYVLETLSKIMPLKLMFLILNYKGGSIYKILKYKLKLAIEWIVCQDPTCKYTYNCYYLKVVSVKEYVRHWTVKHLSRFAFFRESGISIQPYCVIELSPEKWVS